MIQALRNPTIGVIGENPMLLTALAIVHEQDNRLPNQRVVLYDRAIEILLTRWEGARGQLGTAADKNWQIFFKTINASALCFKNLLLWHTTQAGLKRGR